MSSYLSNRESFFNGVFIGVIFLSEKAENLYRIKIALQLSFIVWVMLCIFMFYATFEATVRMWGTMLLLFMVVIFTPFLPDGAGSEDRET
jgi:hypothetical protein